MQLQKKKIKIKLSELEKDILLFFVQSMQREMKLKTILINYHGKYQQYIVMEAIVKLCKLGYLLLHTDTTVTFDNPPLLLQTFMNFERITTAQLLYFIIVQNRSTIKKHETATFNRKMFLIPRLADNRHISHILTLYCTTKEEIHKSTYELVKRGLLYKKGRLNYVFDYNRLDPMLLEYLVRSYQFDG